MNTTKRRLFLKALLLGTAFAFPVARLELAGAPKPVEDDLRNMPGFVPVRYGSAGVVSGEIGNVQGFSILMSNHYRANPGGRAV